jgi:hypothetical protein
MNGGGAFRSFRLEAFIAAIGKLANGGGLAGTRLSESTVSPEELSLILGR